MLRSGRPPRRHSESAETCSTAAYACCAQCTSVTRCAPAPRLSHCGRTARDRAGRRPGWSCCGYRSTTSESSRCSTLALPDDPLRDPDASTGHADSFDDIPADAEPVEDLPWGWRLGAFRPIVIEPGTIYDIEVRDTVTGAPELARATLNLAATHTDPAARRTGVAWSTAGTPSRSPARMPPGHCPTW